MNNRGATLRLMGDFRGSEKWLRQALALRPDYGEAWNNLGNVLKDLGAFDEAIKAYKQALQKEDRADGHHNLAMALLASGDFAQGWDSYEKRWQSKQMVSTQRSLSKPLWLGKKGQDEKGLGRILLVHAEQGFGDSIQFCRYASLAANLGFRVMLEVQPELVKLMRSLKGVECVMARGDVLPPYDLHCPMLSLPRAFDTRFETIPATVPYLYSQEEARSLWQQRFADVDASVVKVGLVWSGSPRLHALDSAAVDKRRSLPPELFLPLRNINHVKFYSLQKGQNKNACELRAH